MLNWESWGLLSYDLLKLSAWVVLVLWLCCWAWRTDASFPHSLHNFCWKFKLSKRMEKGWCHISYCPWNDTVTSTICFVVSRILYIWGSIWNLYLNRARLLYSAKNDSIKLEQAAIYTVDSFQYHSHNSWNIVILGTFTCTSRCCFCPYSYPHCLLIPPYHFLSLLRNHPMVPQIKKDKAEIRFQHFSPRTNFGDLQKRWISLKTIKQCVYYFIYSI